jgi:hypothetical protein
VRAAGYPAAIRPERNESGAFDYRVRIAGLATREDAAAMTVKLKSLGLMEAAVSR